MDVEHEAQDEVHCRQLAVSSNMYPAEQTEHVVPVASHVAQLVIVHVWERLNWKRKKEKNERRRKTLGCFMQDNAPLNNLII